VKTQTNTDEHSIHRLEAFSDIVMGFGLAELGLILVLPKSSGFSTASSAAASVTMFILAFILVSILWWLHHRTFTTYFVLNAPMVLMNFAMLGALIVALYFYDSVINVAFSGRWPLFFFGVFVFAFATVYTLLGGMLLAGLLMRREELSPADVRWSIAQLVTIAIAIPLLICGEAHDVMIQRMVGIGHGTLAACAIVFVINAFVLPRWLLRKIPDTP
jgi:uncharacterized membrane protein